MVKSYLMLKILFLILLSLNGFSQSSQRVIDSLKQLLKNHPVEDSVKADIYALLSVATSSIDKFECINYLNQALHISQRIKNKDQEAGIRIMLGFAQMETGQSIQSIENFQTLLNFKNLSESTRNLALNFIGLNYKAQGDLDKALQYSREADQWETTDPRNVIMQPYNYGDIFFRKNEIDSALKFGKKAFENLNLVPQWVVDQFSPQIAGLVGETYILLNQKDSAYYYIQYALDASNIGKSKNYINTTNEIGSELSLAKWYNKWGSKDSAYSHGSAAYTAAKKLLYYDLMFQCALFLKSVYYGEKKYADALYYQDLASAAKDSLQGLDKIKKTQALHYDYQLQEQQVENVKNELRLNNRVKLLGVTSLFIGFTGIFLFTNIQRRKKTINQLNEQNTVIETQKTQLHVYIDELKEKQTQLIHAEKMASLGELTAGIAHEIQNPLNFVNNFSALNCELIEELKSEQSKIIREPFIEDEILINLENNSRKIEMHGKRAENIVRSMLEHSQIKKGEKTNADINEIVEEYLKLSYHAVRAKENSFNVNLITDLDPSIPLIKIIPSDIGRVLINIYNNAFYSIHKKLLNQGLDYTPSLYIRTQNCNTYIEIRIKDTGLGIPITMLSKVFQPFYTTKPTGSGTGLGLSLSYDIITNTHGGTIEIESEEGQYCTIVIRLPID